MTKKLIDIPDNLGDILYVRVTPAAASNQIKFENQEDGSILTRIYVTTAPENGKANDMVIKLLAKALGVAKSSLTITHGFKNKDKIISINR